ncbi:MAG: hypothetical protein ACRCUE_03695 [Bosea sp. (in: a-proteobacteria)]
MKNRSKSAFAAIICSIFGCDKPPASVSVESLSFPAVLITRSSARGQLPCHASRVEAKEHLSLMRLEIYSTISDRTFSAVPIVIDGTAKILEMKDIVGERGGLWMMANPTGQMPIRFTLSPRKDTGFADARSLIAHCRYLGRDLDDERTELRRNRIRLAKDMTEILRTMDDRSGNLYPGERAPRP